MSHTFRVWAPRAAATVELLTGDDRHAMDAEAGGWWSVTLPRAGAGTRYSFSIDGGPPRPDPRSQHQPLGIDGPSEVVDHSSFAWTDAAWRGRPLARAVVYELHVGTFTEAGTFDAAAEKLPHLVELGVDLVELLPVVEFSGDRGWGYDGVDLYAPHHAYGGPDGLKRFVDAAHAAGVGVIVDVVYNHLGPAGNHLAEFGPYFTDKYATPWGMAVNLDGPGCDEPRRFFLDNARMWLRDYHADGLRIDAVHALVDMSATHLLEQLAVEVEALEAELGRDLVLIAETDLNDARIVSRREVGGYGIDAQWNDDFHHCIHTLLTGERSGYYESFGSVAQLATAYRRGFVYAGEYDPHRGRRHGRAPRDIPAWRFLGYAQNHDQVGNRAQGERTSHLLGVDQLRLVAALVLTAPFVPMLFQGEEWGATSPFLYFTDHHDPDLGRAVSEGRRGEFSYFGWSPDEVPDPQEEATFLRSKLRWDELGREPHRSLLDWHRRLVSLRRAHPALGPGRFEDVDVAWSEDGWIVVVRIGPGDGAVVAANLTGATLEVTLPHGVLAPLACSGVADLRPGRVTFDPWGVAVLRCSGRVPSAA
ncbi:MAG TPA: malto-oligosyltrehalose trehalohydrolase [Acidimicrobiales bacterium]|nr:malto-oligosyltrehalose trehalohydrolase [Acidimicrobiales bacterium]